MGLPDGTLDLASLLDHDIDNGPVVQVVTIREVRRDPAIKMVPAFGQFLFKYLEDGVLAENPFSSLDQRGVGRLVQLATTEGINYLLIVRQLLLKSSDMLFLGHPEGKDSARLRIFSMFLKITTDVPREVRPTRVVLGAGLIFNSLATYAQAAEAGDKLFSGSRELFVSNLLDNLEALLTSRPSKETLDILDG